MARNGRAVAESALERSERQLRDNFRRTFASTEGQATLMHLRELFYDIDFNHEWSPERMSFHAGQHALMRYILDNVGER